MIETSITKSDVRDAKTCLASLKDADELLSIIKACKLDCAEDDDRCNQMKGFLTGFLDLFGAKFPTR